MLPGSTIPQSQPPTCIQQQQESMVRGLVLLQMLEAMLVQGAWCSCRWSIPRRVHLALVGTRVAFGMPVLQW